MQSNPFFGVVVSAEALGQTMMYWVVGLAGKRSRSEVFTRTVQAEEDDVAQEKDDDELYNEMWQ